MKFANMKNVLAVCSAVLVLVFVIAKPRVHADDEEIDTSNIDGSQITASALIQITDTGWGPTGSTTFDCAPDFLGWGDDEWELTLTIARDLTVRVQDCCVVGDYYEIWVDDCLIGTTPVPVAGGGLSDGTATVSLEPGVYTIRIRDAAFATNPGLCPAGYTVTGTLGDFTNIEPCTIDADIDIKPGSCPNPFNGKSKGSVPVAILGSALFDATTINPASICLTSPSGVEVCALEEFEIKDTAQPDGDPEDCFDCFNAEDPANFNCDTDGDGALDSYCGDGFPDLVVKFDTQALAAAIGAADRDDCVELILTGETDIGTPLTGMDSMVIKTKIK